jgi:hypothetical protein
LSRANVVGIEGGTDGKGEDLASMRVLHDDGAVERLDALHGVVKSLLGHELDIGVEGEDEVLAGLWIALLGAEHVAARVERGEHTTRLAV